MSHRRSLLVTAAFIVLITGTKGFESSYESSAETSGEENGPSKEEKKDEKGTGLQNRFWMPTYEGTNPLFRRKIAITTSEIEKYDRTIDVSLSGVRKSRRHKTSNEREDESSMPFIWSGDELSNATQYLPSVESDLITLESESKSNETSKDKPTRKLKSSPSYEDSISKGEEELSKIKKTTTTKPKIVEKRTSSADKIANKTSQNKLIEKDLTSQFYSELYKFTNSSQITADYYKNLVKIAMDNTKQRLGYNKMNTAKSEQSSKHQGPEIFKVNIDRSRVKPKRIDDITFITQHDQSVTKRPIDVKTMPKVKKFTKTELDKQYSIREGNFTREDSALSSYSQYESSSESREENNGSLTGCDYDGWSDILCQNKTDRKAKQRKPKTAPIKSYRRPSSEIQKWPGKDIKSKAEELRKKKGKTRKQKREKELKKKHQQKNEDRRKERRKPDDNETDYDYDQSERKIRMRTKGEKQHAIKEVKSYLEYMDDKYGGRPGREESYTSRKKYERSYERGRGKYQEEDRTKGRDRRRGRGGGFERRDRWQEKDKRGFQRYGRDARGRGGRSDERRDRWQRGNDFRGFQRYGRDARSRGGRFDERRDRWQRRSDFRGYQRDTRGKSRWQGGSDGRRRGGYERGRFNDRVGRGRGGRGGSGRGGFKGWGAGDRDHSYGGKDKRKEEYKKREKGS